MNPTPHRNPKKHEHRSGPSNFADGVDALLKPGTVIDGFTRLSALGLELATIDGPCRLQRLEEDGGPGGQPVLAEGNDEEEDEEFLTRQAELEEMDRAELKAELKKVDPSFRVFKSHSDDDLRDAILDAEFPA